MGVKGRQINFYLNGVNRTDLLQVSSLNDDDLLAHYYRSMIMERFLLYFDNGAKELTEEIQKSVNEAVNNLDTEEAGKILEKTKDDFEKDFVNKHTGEEIS